MSFFASTACQFIHSNTNIITIQTLRHEKNQLQRQLNNQIQKFTTLQLQYNKNDESLKNGNAKYIALLSKYKQSNLINSQLQQKYNLLKQEYDKNNESWNNKCSQLYTEYQTNVEQWNNKYNLLFNERNRLMNQYTTLYSDDNDKITPYQSLQDQFDVLNNRYTILSIDYIEEKKQWLNFYKNQSNEQQTLQKHIRKIESELKQVILKYRNIIPDTNSTNNSPSSPEHHHITQALSNINIILFENNKYCFNYDNTLKLFDKIINRFDCIPNKIKHCIQCIESVHAYFDAARIGGLFFERQQNSLF